MNYKNFHGEAKAILIAYEAYKKLFDIRTARLLTKAKKHKITINQYNQYVVNLITTLD